jgi:hypothetical protein
MFEIGGKILNLGSLAQGPSSMYSIVHVIIIWICQLI